MRISVIIPVYNCVAYMEQAVLSALEQEEVVEVLLIDDKSKDGSGEKARDLAEENPDKIRYLEHFDKQNHGAGESRNLGIREAKCEYLAFLDADDYYLPGRFINARELFEKFSDIDGVYEAVENIFENEVVKNRFIDKRPERYKQGPLKNHLFLYSLDKKVSSENLFESLIKAEIGFLHLNGLVIKKSIVDKAGFFNPAMRLAQDTDFFLRLAYSGKLVNGNLDIPVAVRRIHDENRIWDKKRLVFFQNKLFFEIFVWLKKQPQSGETRKLVIRQYLKYFNNMNLSFLNRSFFPFLNFFHFFILRILWTIKSQKFFQKYF